MTAGTTTISRSRSSFGFQLRSAPNDAGLHAKHSQRSGAANHFLHGEFEFDYSCDPGHPVLGGKRRFLPNCFSGRRRGREHQYFRGPRANHHLYPLGHQRLRPHHRDRLHRRPLGKRSKRPFERAGGFFPWTKLRKQDSNENRREPAGSDAYLEAWFSPRRFRRSRKRRCNGVGVLGLKATRYQSGWLRSRLSQVNVEASALGCRATFSRIAP